MNVDLPSVFDVRSPVARVLVIRSSSTLENHPSVVALLPVIIDRIDLDFGLIGLDRIELDWVGLGLVWFGLD